MLIDGTWTASSTLRTQDVINPADGAVVSTIPVASVEDLDRALAAASRGAAVWKATTPWERSAVLRRTARILAERHEDIARVLTTEQGKTLAEARLEVGAAIDQFDWYADEAKRIYGRSVGSAQADLRLLVVREPVGAVAAFTPWNFPALLPARKLAPALAAGCSIILKPAEEAPSAALELARALTDAGLPDGVLGVVLGDPAQISAHLLSSPVIKKLSLTGSVQVGRHLMKAAADNITNVSMELGGHAPVLVFADADPIAAARMCAIGKFRNAGQVCVAPTRFYVHDSIAEAFIAEFIAVAAALRVGPGLDEGSQVGPLTSERRLVAVEELVADAVAHGATVAVGGARIPELPGSFYSPTVLLDVPDDAAIMQTEPFGPVAPISTFSSFGEAIERANSTPYGLAGYLFTNDLTTATRASEELEVGMVGVNSFSVSLAQVPFSGVNLSGIGAENGTEALDSYLHSKTIALGIGPRA
ncbi:NAD-dependent succinate-semialdehyde dehydrogenase [Leifsonia kafniensis]|uniref:NAD-dependent succinate-semialdehyde dehydrogenase n=1 Tax=Leifsonia kafniensis TaxID=475957 RepID=A0ABP7KGC5_9MICO